MENLKLEELAELLLAASCEETEALGHTSFFISVNEVANNLGVDNREQIVDACHLLEEKGLILLAFDHATALSASITPAGEAYVEEGGETGIIGEYRRFKAARHAETAPQTPYDTGILTGGPGSITFDTYEPPETETKVAHTAASEGIRHLTASMEMLVQNAPLPENVKSDLVVDIRTLELQMTKASPDRAILDMVSTGLKEVPGLPPLVDLLLSMADR